MPSHHIINGKKVWFTPEEEAARTEETAVWASGKEDRSWTKLRAERNFKLNDTDWWILRGSINEIQTKYRQDLRDLPVNVDISQWPDIIWPTKPEN